MTNFESNMSVSELIEKWDEYTSAARFAGSDDTMDLIFIAKRKDKKVKLVRRARSSYEPFSTVFRGKISESENGSKISGIFTKSIIDYVAVTLIIGLLFYIRAVFIERGDALNTVNVLLACAVIGGGLLLYNTRASKRRYADFITRITGCDNKYFLSKREVEERENNDQ